MSVKNIVFRCSVTNMLNSFTFIHLVLQMMSFKICHCLTSAINENHATVAMLIHQALMKEWHGSGQGETVKEDFKIL